LHHPHAGFNITISFDRWNLAKRKRTNKANHMAEECRKQRSTRLTTLNLPSHPPKCKCKCQTENVVPFLHKELVEKSHELGFNVSKTFGNHSKHLITSCSTVNLVKSSNSTIKNFLWWAEPGLNRRTLVRKALVVFSKEDSQLECFRDF
jgi:hypothetical protein